MEEEAKRLWELYSSDAEWEPYGHIDDFCWACIIVLEIDGFVFEGEGQIIGGSDDNEIEYVYCTCPDGTVVKIV